MLRLYLCLVHFIQFCFKLLVFIIPMTYLFISDEVKDYENKKSFLTQTQKMKTLNVICVGKYLQIKMSWKNMNQVKITVDMGVKIVELTAG